ncbi:MULTISPECIES: alpha/beta hydrolase [unclassified Mesorhizobium]|uniref:alpha/beta fold hydrolase n=1 Tax=unclassified Mesorhizobium TaxID=325217 RepID=UPI0003CE3C2C|nr:MULTISPECIES: alpha/beta hydrolase [unclassified Mesorhizobium]ESY51366.1 alpha/beta hydrolase [Mesorhizobium sp. LNJC374B00]ESY56678.1 alpha/beta hydrolase [Mesorhizobium sp. LNJC372A00]WJI81961.1 alpha/beta hydrolase [Mesorhizobium sp. C374B]WJI88481.1 alpha/beta hydrolase [Mesorhizobium sp. C372A]
MRSFVNIGAIVGAFSLAGATVVLGDEPKPTIVLVHGAFAESASWNGVIADLIHDGFTVIAAANPLRSVSGDAAYVASVIGSVKGPVVLVGHSYAGAVISAMAGQLSNVRALVYVAAFEPEIGESSLELTGKFPGSTLGSTLAPPVNLPNGDQDLYIQQDKFHAQFAADLPEADARLMSAAQRPVNQAALAERAVRAAWKTIPSWSIYGGSDRNIPPAAMAFMAERAHARKTVVVPGASHLVMVSHPREVAALIEDAANAK